MVWRLKHTQRHRDMDNTKNAIFTVFQDSLYRVSLTNGHTLLAVSPPETTPRTSGTPEGLVLRAAASIGKQVLYSGRQNVTRIQGLGVHSP